MAKKFTLKILAFSLLFSSFSFLFPLNSQAAGQFSTAYNIKFNFADNGQARVTQKITLTNLTDNFIAKNYSLTISSDKITDVTASDGTGSVPVTTKVENKSTVIVANLNQKVVGKNKSFDVTVSYTIDSLAVKRGRIWEINIPEFVAGENVSSFDLTVSVPNNFGALGRMSPTASSVVPNGAHTDYIFNQKALSNTGIGASFGDYQLFKFTLKYRYKNPNFYATNATVALPPDTEYQAMYYESLEPRPVTMKEDANGNYLATYTVGGGKTLEVTAVGYVKLIDAATPFQVPREWSSQELAAFTKSDDYIQSDNVLIQKKAKELKDIKEIYDYVATTLKYDYNRLNNTDKLGRRGALATLNNPDQSICTDYSDLFVALARAKGIPARGLIGFAYSDNSQLQPTKVEGLVDTTILHAWPEYYDAEKKHWVQVDPTWGSTTGGVDFFNRLDTNHFVFAIYGTSSRFPYPAGAYKLSPNEIDDVKVEIVDKDFEQAPKVALNLSNTQLISGFPANTKLSVENQTGRALFRTQVTAGDNSTLGISGDKTFIVGTVLPFAKQTFDLRLRSASLLKGGKETLVLTLDGKDQSEPVHLQTEKEVIIEPFFSFQGQQLVLLVIFGVVIISWLYPHLPFFRTPSQAK